MSSSSRHCLTCRADLPPGATACPACSQPVPPPLPGEAPRLRHGRHWIVPAALLVPAGLCAATAKLEGLPVLLALAGSVVSAAGGAYWAAGWKARLGAWWIVPCALIGLAFGAVSLVLCFFRLQRGRVQTEHPVKQIVG